MTTSITWCVYNPKEQTRHQYFTLLTILVRALLMFEGVLTVMVLFSNFWLTELARASSAR
jgi:hypothetical protein